MRQKFFLRVAAAALFVAVCVVAASAQVVQISGKITLKQADGKVVPVKDAIVDIFRVDITGKFQVKTDKEGRYTHAGIPFSGKYSLAVSAPNMRPSYVANVKLNQQPENNFELIPGDGHRLTLEEIKTLSAAAGAPSGGGQPSESDKKAAAEMQKQIEEINKKNEKIQSGNDVVKRTFETGNKALEAKNYEAALVAYEEGLAARPDEAGLLINKAVAMTNRGVTRFNTFIQSKDESSKDAAYKDWSDAAATATRAVELLKTAATDPTNQASRDQNRIAALSARAEAMKFVGTKVDRSQADAAFAAYQEYAAAETNEAKKSKAQFEAANIYFESGGYDRAAAEFQKVIAADPTNADAYFKLGAALLNTGDKTKYQQASNYLSKFAEIAPETNPLKADAKSLLQFLKENENIKPMKIETPRTGRRRG
jgi:tetratricopeptide (TPR) repeat protein